MIIIIVVIVFYFQIMFHFLYFSSPMFSMYWYAVV